MHRASPSAHPTLPAPGPQLADLLGARICHDLISPVGAIGNGVELLSLDGAAGRPEIALIADSVAAAQARIRFFRIAFGDTGAGHGIGQPEVRALLADWTRGGRLQIDWTLAGDLPRHLVKRIFLALLCVETCLPLGGRITVAAGPGRHPVLSASARRITTDRAPLDLLRAPAGLERAVASLTADRVQFGLLAADLQAAGLRAEVDVAETTLSMTFRP